MFKSNSCSPPNRCAASSPLSQPQRLQGFSGGLSELGLTQAEVDTIMRDVTGQAQLPSVDAVAPGAKNTNSTVTTTGNRTGPGVKVATTLPPALGPGGSGLQPVKKKSTGVAPAIVGATTGFILGGPPGALIGAAGMWLLNKAITPK